MYYQYLYEYGIISVDIVCCTKTIYCTYKFNENDILYGNDNYDGIVICKNYLDFNEDNNEPAYNNSIPSDPLDSPSNTLKLKITNGNSTTTTKTIKNKTISCTTIYNNNIINIISVINSRVNYTMISLPNPPNGNQIPAIETTAQLLDIGDGMDIGQCLASKRDDTSTVIILSLVSVSSDEISQTKYGRNY
eukprot:87573_1